MAIMDLFTSLQTIINERSAKKVRQSIHDGIFRANQVVDANKNLVDQVAIRQDAVEQYNDQMIAEMTDKDVISAPELIQMRDGEATANERLERDLGDMTNFRPEKVSIIDKFMDELGERYINVKWFGAKGNGVDDDVPGIQAAINYAEETGGTVLMPRINHNWVFASKNSNNNCIEVPSGVKIISEKLPTDRSKQIIKVTTSGVEHVFHLLGGNNLEIENLYIDTNGLAKKGICSTSYISKFLIKNIRVNNATEIGVDVMGYLGELNNITCFKSPIGTRAHGGEVGGTSIQLNRVYSIECDENIVIDNLVYSTLNTCASDRNIVGYHIKNSEGITIINPGIEDAITSDESGRLANYKPFWIEDSKFISVVSPSFVVAPTANGFVIPSLFYLDNIEAFNISAVFVNFLNYDKVLRIEGNSSKIQVNDRSFDSIKVTNNSTHTSAIGRAVQYIGYKADSGAQNRWTSPLYGGWTGEIRYTRNGTGSVTVYGSITGGTIIAGTRIGSLEDGYRPPVNWMVEVVNTSTLTPVGAKLIIKPDGDIVIPPGQTLVAGTQYNFGTSYERHV